MQILAFVFCYNRPKVLQDCINSIFGSSSIIPSEIVFVDDGSSSEVVDILLSTRLKYAQTTNISIWLKGKNLGFSDSAVKALNYARWRNPDYLFFIEADYVFERCAFDLIINTFQNTPQGSLALGIVGADAPYAARNDVRTLVFPQEMIRQIGEDNVVRTALYKPVSVFMGTKKYHIELHSNTCWTCYLNWQNIKRVAAYHPEIEAYLDRACAPIEDLHYPTSKIYRDKRVVDDGMLSHTLSFFWNRWAITNRVNRNVYGAWLNVMPTLAIHHSEGGMHHS